MKLQRYGEVAEEQLDLIEEAMKDPDLAFAFETYVEAAIKRASLRVDELLETIRRLAQETPFPEEAQDALKQRGALLAEIGTLKAEVRSLTRLYKNEKALRDRDR